MNHRIIFLKLVFWIGALLDAIMLIPMLSPEAGGAMFGISNFHPGPEYRYAMGIGASLMAGWTALLVWAHREPVARRGVLLLTTIPVVTGMIGANIYAGTSGLVPFGNLVPLFLLQGLLAVLFLTAYFVSRPAENSIAP